MDLALRRRFLAEEIAASCNVGSPALIDALARVPREAFLPPGPWLVRGEGDVSGAPRMTSGDDPAQICHNVSVAIDPARQLFNGAPSVLARAIAALALERGQRVLHVGCGLGYYSCILGEIVGETGHVLAIDIDEALAADAGRRLASRPWIAVQAGNGTGPWPDAFDAILINAGVTHPRDEWLDALKPGGRLVLPLTVTMPAMGPIGKGPMLRLTRTVDGAFTVEPVTVVAIYSAVEIRDDAINAALGRALMGGGMGRWPKRLRRDAHEPGPACWLHMPSSCFALD
jgi:protein-L-isoaspartate(D-aspartate) O-methyltransferase